MPNTKIKKDSLKDFFFYHKWMYIMLAVVVCMLADILFSATEYRSPNERQVSIQVVSMTATVEGSLPLVAEIALAAGQEFDETLEEVVFYELGYDPHNDTDGYGGQKYMLMLGVGEGDIYMVSEELMHSMVNNGYALPLEGYIEQGILDPGDVDLESVTFRESPEIDDYDPEARHIYAIPMVNMNEMLYSNINFDNRNSYMVLMGFSKNPETSAFVMSNLIEQLTGPLPEWITPAANDSVDPADAFDSVLQDAGFATPAPAAGD